MGVRRAVATPAVTLPPATIIPAFTTVTAAVVGVATTAIATGATIMWRATTVMRRATAATPATSRTRGRAPIGRVLGAKQAHGDEVAEHHFVEQGFGPGQRKENEAVVILQQPARLLNEQGFGPGQRKEIICPGHHLHLAKVLSAG
jgi:hypothetical protein